MGAGRVSCDRHHIGTHLIDVHLIEALVGQATVQRVQRTTRANQPGLGVDAVVPLLVLACLVDHVDLYIPQME